ncbi:MAG: type I phosphomannose isomerase catalytic subunit [Bacteroidota bacterium]
MALKNKLYPLYGKLQHYSWGGYDYIPALLDIINEEKKPYAEYWMGIHHLASAEIGEDHKPLSKFIEGNKTEVLGEYVAGKFGNLPYLFKILDVRDMLSIQVHPSKKEWKRHLQKKMRQVLHWMRQTGIIRMIIINPNWLRR